MSVRAALLPLVLTVAACGGIHEGGDGTLELFYDTCPVPGWRFPWDSPLSERWTRWARVSTTSTAAYASFQAIADGSPRSMIGAEWRNVLTAEETTLDVSVEVAASGAAESFLWSFDESGLTEADILGWQTTGRREIADIPEEWAACDSAVVTGAVTGVYRHGPETWTFEGQLSNAEGPFMVHFHAGPEHGDVDVRLEFANSGDLISVAWLDQGGDTVASGWIDIEAAAD